MKAKRKILATLCIFIVTSVLMVMLAACVNGVQQAVSKVPPKKVYAFSAMTSATLMAAEFGAEPAAETDEVSAINKSALNADQPARPENLPEGIEQIDSFIKMFEGYLVDNGVNETVSAPTDADGDYKDYKVKTTMEVKKLDGEKDRYTMYYTEFDQKTNISLNAEAYDDDNETEIATRLSGVMIFNGAVYPVEGKKEIETEDNETEVSIKFTTRLKDGDDLNYITVEQETENDEAEYEYTVVKDGKVLTKTKIEIEKEEDGKEEEVKLTFIDKSDVPSKTTYSFEREVKSDKTEIVIKYNATGNASGVIRVVVDENGQYHYRYQNGYEEDFD